MSYRSQRAAYRSRLAKNHSAVTLESPSSLPHNTVSVSQPTRTLVRDLTNGSDRLRMADLVASALPGATPFTWVLESLPVGDDDR